MRNYTVGFGDTISKIILREYAIDASNWSSTLMDCMIRYISILNGKDLSLYDNIDSHNILDPDSLKPNQTLIIPDSIAEATADPKFKTINKGACYALFDTADAFTPGKKDPKYLYWIGGGLLALGAIYFLTKKKKKKL